MWLYLFLFIVRCTVLFAGIVLFVMAGVSLKAGWEDHEFKGLTESIIYLAGGCLMVFDVVYQAFPQWFIPNAQ